MRLTVSGGVINPVGLAMLTDISVINVGSMSPVGAGVSNPNTHEQALEISEAE